LFPLWAGFSESYSWSFQSVEMADAVIAFSSEVDTGSREENASKQESRASVLIQSEPIML
ncbi:MAG TPA: hypothetical protein VI009_22125, partial [Xanthobacteraceae bacterium]